MDDDQTLQSTSPLGATDMMSAITTVHLVLIALFAVAAVAIIIWGTKRWRANKRAMAELEAEGRLDHSDPSDTTTPDSPAPEPAAPPPSSPEPVARAAEPAPVVAPVSEAIPQPIPAAPAPPPVVEPAPVAPVAAPAIRDTPPVTVPTASAASGQGDLTRLKGLGPKVAARLAELDITGIADLAALDDAQAAALDAQLGNFKGRMGRDRWIEQARLLDAGDVVGYEAQFGKLG